MQGYTTDDVLQFLNWAGSKGYMKKSTVSSRRVSCGKVFGILEAEEKSDVRTLDVEAVMSRFATLEGENYSTESLSVYKSRVAKSLEEFLQYKENPMSYRPSAVTRTRTRASGTKAEPVKKDDSNNQPKHTDTRTTSNPVVTIDLPIAIRMDCIVQLNGLPVDLKRDEAQKIANVVLAMASIPEE